MLEGQGVRLKAEGEGKLKLYAPPDRIPAADILAELRASKGEVLGYLRERALRGQIQFVSLPDHMLRQTDKLGNTAPAVCWHCGGSGDCDCSTCGVMRPSVIWAAGVCVACKSRKSRVQ